MQHQLSLPLFYVKPYGDLKGELRLANECPRVFDISQELYANVMTMINEGVKEPQPAVISNPFTDDLMDHANKIGTAVASGINNF